MTTFERGTLHIYGAPTIGEEGEQGLSEVLTAMLQPVYPGIRVDYFFDTVVEMAEEAATK
jgi:hypothetical protein